MLAIDVFFLYRYRYIVYSMWCFFFSTINLAVFVWFVSITFPVVREGVINFIVASPFLRLIDPIFDLPAMSSPFGKYFVHFSHSIRHCQRFIAFHSVLVSCYAVAYGNKCHDLGHGMHVEVNAENIYITSSQSNWFGIVQRLTPCAHE